MSQIGELNKLVEKITGQKKRKKYNTIKKCLDAISTYRSGEKVKSYNMESAIQNVTRTYVGGSSIELQEKSVTITENGTSTITPDEGYGGISQVNLTTNVAGCIDWSEIGYEEEPYAIEGILNASKEIQNNWDSSTTSMANMYSASKDFLFFPFIDTSNVTSMRNSFNGSTIYSIPLLDTSNVTEFYATFRDTKIYEVPQFDLANCTDASYCFTGCGNLKNVPVFDLGSKKVVGKSVSNMFLNCPSLTNLSLNNIMKTMTTVNMYSGNKNLKNIGLTEEQATTCTTLSNWAELQAAGWTTGYES